MTSALRLLAAAAVLSLAVSACTDEDAATSQPASPSATVSSSAQPRSTSPVAPAPSATSSATPPPTPFDPGAPREPTGEPVTLAFGGDVSFEGVVRERLNRDPETTFGPVAEVLRDADLAMINLETTITERGTPEPKEYNYRAPTSAFDALTGAGVDVATMANNHGVDFGQVGLRDSIAAAEDADFPVIGIGMDDDVAFAPYRTTINGQRIAVIGTTQVLDSFAVTAWRATPDQPGLASARDVDRLVRAVREARTDSDTVVVFLHWGQERNNCPLDRQIELAEQLVAAGADVLVGSHAHVLLGSGYLSGAYVHYGLGNFVWYAARGEGAETGVLTLTMQGRAVTDASWTPAYISNGATTPLTGDEADRARAEQEDLRDCTGLSASPD